mmetsp:Transcript_24358/g.45369  ORF Transcript_24358/g.45369 Transcript_24358/m.45369 type:complete len:116 (-) Transcript_24358:1581-1928(-)
MTRHDLRITPDMTGASPHIQPMRNTMNNQYGLGITGSQHGNYNNPSFVIAKQNRAAADKFAASMSKPAGDTYSGVTPSAGSHKTGWHGLLVVLGILLGMVAYIAGGVTIFNAYAL